MTSCTQVKGLLLFFLQKSRTWKTSTCCLWLLTVMLISCCFIGMWTSWITLWRWSSVTLRTWRRLWRKEHDCWWRRRRKRTSFFIKCYQCKEQLYSLCLSLAKSITDHQATSQILGQSDKMLGVGGWDGNCHTNGDYRCDICKRPCSPKIFLTQVLAVSSLNIYFHLFHRPPVLFCKRVLLFLFFTKATITFGLALKPCFVTSRNSATLNNRTVVFVYCTQRRGRGTEAWQACNTWVFWWSYNLLQWNHGIHWSGFREYAYGGEIQNWKIWILITNYYKFRFLFVYAFFYVIYQTKETKETAQRSIFDEPQGVWKCGESLSSHSKIKLRRKRRKKNKKSMLVKIRHPNTVKVLITFVLNLMNY